MRDAFDRYCKRYDAWYDRNKYAYLAELKAIRKVLPKRGIGLEVGVGTGRFAARLGIRHGIDPSPEMIALARKRGVNTKVARGEKLPFNDNEFDYMLIAITLSFVKNPKKVISECRRVLKNRGRLIVAIIDKNSFLGRFYRQKKGVFYKQARLFSVTKVISLLKKAGFKRFIFYQTLFQTPDKIKTIEPVKKGYGKGGFVVICARI